MRELTYVVYLSFSTSNHNLLCCLTEVSKVVYLSFSTSNHNYNYDAFLLFYVVYLSFSTSNHNFCPTVTPKHQLYIFRFLHQTTTRVIESIPKSCCISFVFYIKPQLNYTSCFSCIVVYLSFSTSNHNLLG